MHVDNQSTYNGWVCPKCKGALTSEHSEYSCERCKLRFGKNYGILDFRLYPSEKESRLALIGEYVERWDELPYQEMVRMRFRQLRQKAFARGAAKSDFKMWNLEEEAILTSYKTRGKRHQALLQNMLRRSDQSEHVMRLVDIGCGWGRDLLHLSSIAEQAVGVDICAFSLLLTKKLLEEHAVSNVTVVLAEGEALPLPSDCVDGINSSATIEHFPVPGDFLSECSRCLNGNGWLCLYYPNRFSALPETHTGIWGLGFWPRHRQREIVKKRSGSEWNTILFSKRSFLRLLKSTCSYDRVHITGMPSGIEEFLQTSKFTKMLPRMIHAIKCSLPIIRRVPVLNGLVSFFSPVHFVMVTRK